MEKTERKGIYVGGEDFDSLKGFFDWKKEDFLEVTQWANGEGWTISISNSMGNRTFELSYDEFELIKYLINKLDYE